MQDDFVFYNGRMVAKDGFRVFVYKENDQQKLANSWEEYERDLSLGWFATKEETEVKVEEKEIPKERTKRRTV